MCAPGARILVFWRELKARVTDTDPQARAPLAGEVKTSEGRIVAYQSRPLPDGATLLAFTDVTDTRALEGALADRSEALEESERLKRDFVGNVSYELRTPLTTIIGYSELLDHMEADLSDRAAPACAVGAPGRQPIGSLHRRRAGHGPAGRQRNGAGFGRRRHRGSAALGRRALERATRLEAGAAIAVACDEDIGVIRADARRLGQTLDHLMENAIRQSPRDGTVTLAAHKALGEIQIQVSDTGRGIPFHVQAHIFDRFIGRERGGPGLGLALVKALVELHGGWVVLQSEPGAGATFTCYLPEIAHPGAAQPELQF